MLNFIRRIIGYSSLEYLVVEKSPLEFSAVEYKYLFYMYVTVRFLTLGFSSLSQWFSGRIKTYLWFIWVGRFQCRLPWLHFILINPSLVTCDDVFQTHGVRIETFLHICSNWIVLVKVVSNYIFENYFLP